eukprot:TRINITY_DN11790_c0_g1_i1.p1 TRINITY_DN11790_c0_g1~~TRINITY_DN11790_c0_g1_i1.p1  ORF type:complete len:193 (-),score=27.65 TRINITY_DN11790_c0_g1_i1:61-639(-)
MSVWETSLHKRRNDVGLSAFAFLFSEMVQYSRETSTHDNNLEKRLADMGHQVGVRILELYSFRDKRRRRITEIGEMLGFIQNVVYKTLLNSSAKLEKTKNVDDEYLVKMENKNADVIVNKFISVPKDFNGIDCASFVAGIVKGCLDGAQMPAVVTAHAIPIKKDDKYGLTSTWLLIKFDRSVIDKQRRSSGS